MIDPLAAWLALFKALFWALFFLATARKAIEARRSCDSGVDPATNYS